MRERELRLALVCYGGVSLAVYMHGITKEIWRLAKASQAHHAGAPPDVSTGSEQVYRGLLESIEECCDVQLRVLVDILAGASAGGINAIFLADAISSGRSLDPLTDLWLDSADVDSLVDEHASGIKGMAKSAAVPFAWAWSARSGVVERTVEPAHRNEIRSKLSNFVRARWFAPPFGGERFTELLLRALQAMEAGPKGAPLLPDYQPLDLFVTVTDFVGFPQELRLHSPRAVTETEHRLTLSFRDPGGPDRHLALPPELVYAARATASFPGAFPPFRITELDEVLAQAGTSWPGRATFLARMLPRHHARGQAEQAVLIDGSILANAPFAPALAALDDRPARREVDRRFVYIDPKPGIHTVRLTGNNHEEAPGFFTTIFGALSDIPREQPIRDNLEAIEKRSARIRRLRKIVEAMRPEAEAAIERAVGVRFFLGRPTARRLAIWRARTNEAAAREAGYAYAAYGQLKIAAVIEDVALSLYRLNGGAADDRSSYEAMRSALWRFAEEQRLNAPDAVTARGTRPDLIQFLRSFDVGFRTRRLRFVARQLTASTSTFECAPDQALALRRALWDMIGRYRAALFAPAVPEGHAHRIVMAVEHPAAALPVLADAMDLRGLDDETDRRFTDALADLPRGDRRTLMLLYLGYPFYDIATLPLLQGEGLDEFDPVKVDRISPDDATAIRSGGAAATLKGIQFNSFGAFFSRAYRENDYLWGRLHGADRLIDIVASTLDQGSGLTAQTISRMKRDAFRCILREEQARLGAIPELLESLGREIG